MTAAEKREGVLNLQVHHRLVRRLNVKLNSDISFIS